ncbi:MAG: hypothetical protein P4N24_22060, partial [Acidobacteriota bacterium]|nr:hypothetical protein [Acidobacteriota bacterium]
PVRNFKLRSVLGVHSLSPDWEASLFSTEAEHITAPASIHYAAATCPRVLPRCSTRNRERFL